MANILNTDLIADAVDPKGLTDSMLEVVKLAVEDEYKKGRITGSDYATVYLGAINSALGQSVAFILGAHTANIQANLIEQQILTEQQNVLKTAAEVSLLNNRAALALKEADKIDQDILLTQQQIITEVKKTDVMAADALKIAAEEALLTKKALTEITNELLVDRQSLKVIEDTKLVINQTATEVKVALREVATTSNIEAEISKTTSEVSLLNAKVTTENSVRDKIASENNLLTQKTATELAQIEDTVAATGSPVEGLIGKQKTLYTAQTDGFKRDAEQKLSKIAVDGYSVYMSTASSPILPTEIDANGVNEIMVKAKQGIGV